MNKYQNFALNCILENWPENFSYTQIIYYLNIDNPDDLIRCHYIYDNMNNVDVAAVIQNLALNAEVSFGEKI